MRTAVTPVVLAVAVAVGLSCSSSDNGGGGGGPAGQLIELAPAPNGNNQTATVDALLPLPLRVLVTELGVPVEGVTVEWETSNPGSAIGSSSVTDPNGIAQTTWKLSQTAGPQSATATLDGATGSPIAFSRRADTSRARCCIGAVSASTVGLFSVGSTAKISASPLGRLSEMIR